MKLVENVTFFYGIPTLTLYQPDGYIFVCDSNTYLIPSRRLHFFVWFQHLPHTSQTVTFFCVIPTLTLYTEETFMNGFYKSC